MAVDQVRLTRTKWVPIDSVTPHPENARRSDTDLIRESLETHGPYAPIVVHEETGHILVHNHVWMVAKELGHKRIYATFVSCSPERARAVLAVDNRTTDDAGYEPVELLALLERLDASGDLAGTGWEGELDDLRNALDEAQVRAETDAAVREDADGAPDRAPRASVDYTASDTRWLTIMLSGTAHARLIDNLALLREHFQTANHADTITALAEAYVRQIEETVTGQ